jgi:hypothetical protein
VLLRALADRASGTAIATVRRVRPRTFTFADTEYRYFVHGYNVTWRNERAVEIPIALRLLDQAGAGRVLEVGNVLSHYGRRGHDVVDKYESVPGVINADIVEMNTDRRYDLILAISTLEHVGFDEERRDVEKPRRAVARMLAMLAPGGTLLVTVPLGYNESLDTDLREGAIAFDDLRYLKRTSADNRWLEVSAAEVQTVAYGHPFPWANGLAIGILRGQRL